ncbi:MAG: DUF4271 domain-containing protein [Bacteroidales bacterium]|nr:DUF4271 domain-containing protein [Bacteroidales bacterium]
MKQTVDKAYQDTLNGTLPHTTGIALNDSIAAAPTARGQSTDTIELISNDSLVILNDTVKAYHTQTVHPIEPLPQEKPEISHDWVTGIIFFGFILLAWIKVSYPKRLSQLWKGFAQQRYMDIIARDGNLFNERIALGLFFIYIINLSLYLLLLNQKILHYPIGEDAGIKAIWTIMYLLFIFVAGKMILMRFVGFIFRAGHVTFAYIMNMLLYDLMAGIVLLPLLLLIHTTLPVLFLKIGAVALVVLYIWRILRGVNIGLSEPRFSIFYFILYLCTLEIFPALLIYKLVSQGVI